MIKKSTTIGMLGTIVFLGFLIALPVNSLATPINVDVGHTGNVANVTIPGLVYNGNVYTEYFLETNLLDTLDAFCVEGVAASSREEEYEIFSVPTYLRQAAWLAGQWWSRNYLTWVLKEEESSSTESTTEGTGEEFWKNATKEDFQIAIWEVVLDSSSGSYTYNETWNNNGSFRYHGGANDNIIDEILKQTMGSNSTNVSWVTNSDFQDYLVNHSVPEPATMLFLGLGLVCLAVLRRKAFLKR